MNFFEFFQNSPDLFFVVDKEGTITEINQAACSRLLFGRSELQGRQLVSLCPQGKQKKVITGLHELAGAGNTHLTLSLVAKTGKVIQAEAVLSQGTWDGKPAVFVLCREPETRKKAVNSPQKSEAWYQILFENINDAVFVHSFDENGLPGTFTEVNAVACQRLGYSREELLSMSPRDIDAPEAWNLVPAAMEKVKTEKFVIWEGIHLSRTGERIPVEISNHLFLLDEEPVILATVRDISGRKRTEDLLRASEEKYRKIFENIQDIFYQADIEGRILEISPSIERYSGYKPEELVGMKVEEVYENKADRSEMMKLLGEKGEISDHIIRLRRKDGQPVFVSANIHLIYGNDGKPSGVEGSLRDVTERIQAEEKLKENEKLLRKQNEAIFESNRQLTLAKEKAEESDRLKSAFLANMSHEIRTPMNGIMGFSMMLADPNLPRDTRDSYVKIVSTSCEQLLHIVNDIIDISKIEAGQVELSESSFDLKGLINEIFNFYNPIAREKGVRLETDQLRCNFSTGSWIVADRTKLRQVFDNLLSNAVKFTPSGKIVIRCILENGHLIFEVQDSGIGIEKHLQELIFERFSQVESSYTKNYGGTGLGLAISKAYVEKMGGSISVRSQPGRGSTFSFRVPYKASAVDSEKREEVWRFRPLDLGISVLVVEDEEVNWLYLNEILKNRVTLLRAVNGKEAIELVRNNPSIDIALMDIKLPDINGLELTRLIRTINSRIRVIAQTAYALAGDREAAIAAGCSGYISKPVNREELLNLLVAYSDK